MEESADLDMILAHWCSEEALWTYLQAQVHELCPIICGAEAPIPRVSVKPSWLAKGLFGEQRAAAQYDPAEPNLPAEISVFPHAASKPLARIAIAHELVHHWEFVEPRDASGLPYPSEADDAISRRFRSGSADRQWRSGHSPVFIAKAAVVARELGVQLQEVLFR